MNPPPTPKKPRYRGEGICDICASNSIREYVNNLTYSSMTPPKIKIFSAVCENLSCPNCNKYFREFSIYK